MKNNTRKNQDCGVGRMSLTVRFVFCSAAVSSSTGKPLSNMGAGDGVTTGRIAGSSSKDVGASAEELDASAEDLDASAKGFGASAKGFGADGRDAKGFGAGVSGVDVGRVVLDEAVRCRGAWLPVVRSRERGPRWARPGPEGSIGCSEPLVERAEDAMELEGLGLARDEHQLGLLKARLVQLEVRPFLVSPRADLAATAKLLLVECETSRLATEHALREIVTTGESAQVSSQGGSDGLVQCVGLVGCRVDVVAVYDGPLRTDHPRVVDQDTAAIQGLSSRRSRGWGTLTPCVAPCVRCGREVPLTARSSDVRSASALQAHAGIFVPTVIRAFCNECVAGADHG